MKTYKYILFDLDGTLTDSGTGITNSVIYALKKFNITVSDKTELHKFIGPPLWESFENFYGFSKEQSQTAVSYYREYYKEKGMLENEVYPGIIGLLDRLKEKGKTLAVATSKPTVFARQILEHFDIAKYFSYVAGGTLDGSRVNKNDVIAHALEECKIKNLPEVVMIGDRKHDIIGAKQIGIDSIGVLYGYGSRYEQEAAGADYIVETADDILTLLSHP